LEKVRKSRQLRLIRKNPRHPRFIGKGAWNANEPSSGFNAQDKNLIRDAEKENPLSRFKMVTPFGLGVGVTIGGSARERGRSAFLNRFWQSVFPGERVSSSGWKSLSETRAGLGETGPPFRP
jgi:hypothetical protein